MSGAYEGRQIVGMDLYRCRSVLVRMTETGQHLETVRISNDPQYLRAGDGPCRRGTRGGAGGGVRLVLGRGHADRARRQVHLAHPLGVKMFLPAGEERPTRRRGPGRSVAHGTATRAVDRSTR